MDKKLQDLAWSVLPKEFKEEVKNRWNKESDYATKYKNQLHNHLLDFMYELFGDNLTFDAEGEEMLTVPRSKVMKEHAEAKSKMDNDWWRGYMIALQELFGSKCLSDNIEDGKCQSKICKEEDMLYVPKSVIQSIFDENKKLIREVNESINVRDARMIQNGLLTSLFSEHLKL